ncbi:diacylglycerol kinase [Tritonibacter sp. SIMBA_163]|uniref:diacylglycerol kinase n=1 Tax=Tritonibacter sp. SIMBA_163 TaxID=3080868 RepID=UPI0039802D56
MTQPTASQKTSPQIPPKVTGLAHLFAAARYSLGGFQRLLAEAAARQELATGGAAIILLWVLGAPGMQIGAFSILFLLLLAIEALNTAIEVLTDLVSPEWSQQAKHAKDLGSLAVALLIGANTACFAIILLSLLN